MSDVLKLDYELIREMGIKFQGLGNEGVNPAVEKLFDDIDGKNFSPSGFLNLAEMSAQLKVDTAFLVAKLEGLGGNLINAAEAIRTQDRYLAEKFMKEAYRMDALEYTSTKAHWLEDAVSMYSKIMAIPDTYNAGKDLQNLTKSKWIGKLMDTIDTVDPAIPYAATKWNSLTKIKSVGGAVALIQGLISSWEIYQGVNNGATELGNAFQDFDKTGDSARLAGEVTESVFDDGLLIVGGVLGVAAAVGAGIAIVGTAPLWLPAVAGLATAAMFYGLGNEAFKAWKGESIGEWAGRGVESLVDYAQPSIDSMKKSAGDKIAKGTLKVLDSLFLMN